MKRKVLFGILPIVLMCACGAPKVTESVLLPASVSETTADDMTVSEEKTDEALLETENEADENQRFLYSATIEALEASKVYTTEDWYSDNVASDYFFIGEFEGSSAELFILTNGAGYIVRVKDDLYPVAVYANDIEPHYMIAADFDKDGDTEYGFTACLGRGTGFYSEELMIIDPGEENNPILFGVDDLMIKDGNFFENVKAEEDKENNSYNFCLDIDGRISDKGSAYLASEITGDHQFAGLVFGDIFYIRFIGDQWLFDALGGTTWSDIYMPQYEDGVHLYGKLIYKDGAVTFSKTGGIKLVPEWATIFENEKTGDIEYGGYTEDFFIYGSGGYFAYSDSFAAPNHGEGVPQGWLSLGGAGKNVYLSAEEISNHVKFEDGRLVECYWTDNHTAIQKIIDFTFDDYSAVVYQYSFDLYTAPELMEKECDSPEWSNYWVIFYTKGEGATLYFKFFNCDYFTEEEAKDSVKY